MILQRLSGYLLLGLIFWMPLLSATLGKGFEEIKVLSLLYGVSFVLFLFVGYLYWAKRSLLFPKIYFYLVFFQSVLLITALTGVNLSDSLFGGSIYIQGWITFLVLLVCAWLIGVSSITQKSIGYCLIGSAVVVSIIAIGQYIDLQRGYAQATYAGRVVSTFGQANFYAGFLLLVLPFLLQLIEQSKKINRFLLCVLLCIVLLAIAISFSRTAIIFAAVLFSGWLIFKLVKTQFVKYLLIIILVIGVIYALFVGRIIQDEIIQPITHQTIEMNNIQKRVFIWQVGIEQIVKRPLVGYGLENIDQAYPKAFDFNHPKPAFYHVIKDLPIDNAHNLILNLLLWGGGLLLIAFTLLVVMLFYYAKDNYLKLGLVLFLSWSLVQNLSIIHWLIFYILIGLVARENLKPSKQ